VIQGRRRREHPSGPGLDRVEAASPLSRLGAYMPLVASFVVLGLGLYLTVQAVSGNTTF